MSSTERAAARGWLVPSYTSHFITPDGFRPSPGWGSHAVNVDGRGSSEPTGEVRNAAGVAGSRRRVRRVLYIWLSVELAAGIVALAEIVFALPPIILLELGKSTVESIVPLTAFSGVLAVYLGWCAFPLVGQVARLGRSPS